MPRRYRRRRYAITRPVKTTKYSNETFNFRYGLMSDTADTHAIQSFPILPVISNNAVLGTRKAKNFTIRINCLPCVRVSGEHVVREPASVVWALVFVSEGNVPSLLNVSTTTTPSSLYEPNQNVIMSGVATSNDICVSKTRLARNLNAGDQLYMILCDNNAPSEDDDSTTTAFYCSVNFAIAF